MIIKPTIISDVFVFEYEPHQDERGYFTRIFCQNDFKKAGIDFIIKQVSQSFNAKKGTVRGMHFQKEPFREQKIVQCLRGAIYDVVVDVRENSPTYRKWIAQRLTEENKKLIYIPAGCAHGFQTLSDGSEVQYIMSEFYSPENYTGLRWDDPLLNIQWPEVEMRIMSEQDKNWPLIHKI